MVSFFYRNDSFVGCERIQDRFCTCFIPNITEAEIKIIKQSVEIFEKGPEAQNTFDKFSVFRPRDLFIVSEFFSRYGSVIRKNARKQ